MNELSRNEEKILLAIWKLKGNAYGVTIRQSVMEMAQKTVHYGSLYNTLDLLIRKGLVYLKETKPQAVRGGRRKKLYFLTDGGLSALNYARENYKLIWKNIPELTPGLEKKSEF